MTHEANQSDALDRLGIDPAEEEARGLDATERLLAGLPVRTPSAELDERVRGALMAADTDTQPYALPWVRKTWATASVVLLGLGIGVAAVMLQQSAPPGDSPTTVATQGDPLLPTDARVAAAAVEQPQPIEQVFVASEPTGRIVFTNGRAMEAVRVTAVRHVSFEEDGVTYDVAEPIEQLVYVPASFK